MNRIALKTIECEEAHLWLDDKRIQTHLLTDEYSLTGRMKLLFNRFTEKLEEKNKEIYQLKGKLGGFND